jgi:hypothetical protein
VQDGWQELDASSRRSSEMVKSWRGLCPAMDCSGLMMMKLIKENCLSWYVYVMRKEKLLVSLFSFVNMNVEDRKEEIDKENFFGLFRSEYAKDENNK